MHCPFPAMLCPFLGMLPAFLGASRPRLAMPYPFVAMLCPFLGMQPALLGASRRPLAMPYPFVAMLCPFLGTLSASFSNDPEETPNASLEVAIHSDHDKDRVCEGVGGAAQGQYPASRAKFCARYSRIVASQRAIWPGSLP